MYRIALIYHRVTRQKPDKTKRVNRIQDFVIKYFNEYTTHNRTIFDLEYS